MDKQVAPRRPSALGVHSVNRFAFTVPDVGEAERFYHAFGLDVRRDSDRLDLFAHAHPHCWASVHGNGLGKKLQYLSFGAYAEDFDALARRITAHGVCEPHPLSDGKGIWTRDADGTPIQVVVAPKVSPSLKSEAAAVAPPPAGQGAAPNRKTAAAVRPRYLSHILLFTPDVDRQLAFYTEVLGLRLSDRSGDIIVFLHGPHASDHHLLAFAKSHAPGLHHSSWDVGSLDDVGLGAELMRERGYAKGWGVGRHVLGSNYFYYVQDPWGSWTEFSFGIDFVPADVEWPAADHPPEDSFYIWGPPVPEDFVTNYEQVQRT
ncbi:MAG TPA: VOC family protein [Casimicrobiaceae bacterium]|jgi:catechol 2,3-dioxygenase-like lactoylglutathione lyase family enzyme